ncbi:hypothetical protein E2562_014574 [Oryza meyeriana var. granulata]|uniref:Mitochondrial import inner membrane translocase subunit TIM22 n=1 Tax=Oryza meyeriana var. granulata TaxID=110450 RepID=A0A6G1EI78_9ORYZ|nr:hypothetical protein E2562_014574 [Oryza meyeriana var. granulata]
MSRAVDVQELVEGRRLYAPERPKAIYDLSTSLECLFKEEALMQTCSWGENLTFYNGISYLTGAMAGALVGLTCAPAEAEHGESAKLRLSRALNQSGSVSRTYANRLGVIAMLFAGSESFVFRNHGKDIM